MSTRLRSSAAFTLFPKLPIEIRLNIWKAICYIQRNVDITTAYYCVQSTQKHSMSYPFFYKSSCPPPAVLHVNQESRSEGLRHYKLDFRAKYEVHHDRFQPVTVIAQPKIYFNWMVDRLCIVEPSLVVGMDPSFGKDSEERAEALGRLCEKRKLQYLGYNCKSVNRRWRIFAGIVDRAVWLKEIALFEETFPEDKCRFSLSFNKHICPQGDCRCVGMKWWRKTQAVERLWKKQERKSNEKASLRFGRLTWISKGRKGNVQV
jgi:hypothetical protein